MAVIWFCTYGFFSNATSRVPVVVIDFGLLHLCIDITHEWQSEREQKIKATNVECTWRRAAACSLLCSCIRPCVGTAKAQTGVSTFNQAKPVWFWQHVHTTAPILDYYHYSITQLSYKVRIDISAQWQCEDNTLTLKELIQTRKARWQPGKLTPDSCVSADAAKWSKLPSNKWSTVGRAHAVINMARHESVIREKRFAFVLLGHCPL